MEKDLSGVKRGCKRFSVAVALVKQFGRLDFQVFDGTQSNGKNALTFLSADAGPKFNLKL